MLVRMRSTHLPGAKFANGQVMTRGKPAGKPTSPPGERWKQADISFLTVNSTGNIAEVQRECVVFREPKPRTKREAFDGLPVAFEQQLRHILAAVIRCEFREVPRLERQQFLR